MPNSKDIVKLPQHILDNYTKTSPYIDVIHINGIMFMVNASKYIGLIQCVCICNKHRNNFFEAILSMLQHTHRARRIFTVTTIGADKAFDLT